MMEDEVVRRRAWISREQFMDLLGAANLIPGPNSTEVAIHIGHRELLDGRSWRSECDWFPGRLPTHRTGWGR